jgi:hypothetical protein
VHQVQLHDDAQLRAGRLEGSRPLGSRRVSESAHQRAHSTSIAPRITPAPARIPFSGHRARCRRHGAGTPFPSRYPQLVHDYRQRVFQRLAFE